VDMRVVERQVTGMQVADSPPIDTHELSVGHTLAPMPPEPHPERIDDIRLDQLMRWHGTDEANLPPAHTLQNLSRDTITALAELQQARAAVATLRAAMGRAFWATEFRDVHAILLEALGPPPDDLAS
jgi:hypothetical protein